MDRLTSGLDPETKEKYSPMIVATLKLAHKKLNGYYSLANYLSYRDDTSSRDEVGVLQAG
jgi:hypothetical protein